MRIGFIGAGKVGFTLGKYLVERDMCVSGYYSRSLRSSKEAAEFTKTKYYESLEELVNACDTLFLTVPDGSIREVYTKLLESDIEGKILCHCSGALSSEVFSGIHKRGAYAYSIHPIFAVSDKLTSYRDLSNAYFTIEGDKERLEEMTELIRHLGNPVSVIAADQKIRYHAAAVFASNLVTGLYGMASQMLCDCGLDAEFAEHALKPLFSYNASNLCAQGMAASLTGPVERADIQTVEEHLEVLTPQEKQVYTQLSKQLIPIAEKKNPGRDYEALKELLAGAEQS